jgi:hypothetical protein
VKIKLANEEITRLLGSPSMEFPKYTTQLINLANQNAQATRPKVVGQMSELIKQFPGRKFVDWRDWYSQRHPEAIEKATNKIMDMLNNLKQALDKIDRDLVEKWVNDLVIVKTFVGLRFQEAILAKIAGSLNHSYKLASPEEESKGIDGYIGETPVSIKPDTYDSKKALPEEIDTTIVIYKKTKTGINIDFDETRIN